jgi:HEAT repeat protein
MITGMLHDPVELVRLRAAAALVHLGVDSHEQIIINRIRGGTASKEVLTMLIHGRGPEAIKILTEYLIGGSALRIPAARGLASLGARETVPQLIDLLNDSEAESARIAGIEALGVLGGPEAIAPLLSRLEDRSTLVRSAAAEALGRIGDARAASALINCLASNDSRLCLAAREALSRLGPFAQLLRATLGNGLPKGRVALGLYEALWRGVEFGDVWDFGDLTEQVANLTYSVTYHKGKLKSDSAWTNTTSYN